MFDEVDAYCSLYVDADLTESALANNLAKLFQVEADGDYVDTPQGTFAVVKNNEFDEVKRLDERKGFLYYRLLLEVEPKTEMGENNAVSFVSQILEGLWLQGLSAVAACHYEDKLPYQGRVVAPQPIAA